MQILLLRHGKAQPKEEAGRDEERGLTSKARKRIAKVAGGLKRLDIFPDRICSSPLKRALETAGVISEELGFAGEVEAVGELAPDSGPEDMLEVLPTFGDGQIVLVGHQPLLGQIGAGLLGIGTGGRITLKKGGVLIVEVEDWNRVPPGELKGLLTAKELSWIRKKSKAAKQAGGGLGGGTAEAG